MMRLLRVCLLLFASAAPPAAPAPAPAPAQPLTIASVSAPAVQCVFSPKCNVAIEDLSAPVAVSGFLQSRNYRAGGGLYVYEYRIDLRDAVGANGITTITVDVGPTTKLDFNGNGSRDDVFVTTKGNLGNVGLLSAVRSGNSVTFTFQRPVGRGDSSFFFGIVSKYPRRNVTASAADAAAPERRLDAWAPSHP